MLANPAHFYKLGGPNTRKVADGFLSIAPFCVRVHTWAAYLANREECCFGLDNRHILNTGRS